MQNRKNTIFYFIIPRKAYNNILFVASVDNVINLHLDSYTIAGKGIQNVNVQKMSINIIKPYLKTPCKWV